MHGPSRPSALPALLTAGLVFGLSDSASAACVDEATCAVKKPLLLFVLDYSTSMNSPISGPLTRWQAAVDGLVDLLAADDGLLADQLQIGVLRFGHDPAPALAGTMIARDASGLVDGQRLDIGFYDALAPDDAYLQCNGAALTTALLAVPPPLDGQTDGIESWTGGALAQARTYLQQTIADHPLDLGTRDAAIVLVTDGPWTDPSGATELAPPDADPALVAADLFNNMSVRTYVVALGEAAQQPWADAIGVAGGTGPARLGLSKQGLNTALAASARAVARDVRLPRCSPTMARAMVLLDASSSLLNINGGTQAGPMGVTYWDQIRDALTGTASLFDRPVLASTREHFSLFGLSVFGHDTPAPGEQQRLVDYGLCHEAQFAWALDPETSCELPGCIDPWAGPPITWTFKNSADEPAPPFAGPVVSHMPRCDLHPDNPQACTGSGSYLHLGLELVQDNLAAYRSACLADDAMPCTATTPFVNVLIVDSPYNSSDAAVQAPLEAMHGAGVTTRVIGFGPFLGLPLLTTQLDAMAAWGSGGLEPPLAAKNQLQLEAALAGIADALPADPCCDTRVCSPASHCGDGIVDVGEECDDGNGKTGDGCKPNCFLEPPDETTTGDETETGDDTETDTDTTSNTSTSSDSTSTSTSTDTTSTTDAITGTTSTTTQGPTTTTTSTTLVPTTDGPPTTQGPGDTSDTTAGSTSATDSAGTGGTNASDGCSCNSDPPRDLGPAMLLAIIGLARRRRHR